MIGERTQSKMSNPTWTTGHGRRVPDGQPRFQNRSGKSGSQNVEDRQIPNFQYTGFNWLQSPRALDEWLSISWTPSCPLANEWKNEWCLLCPKRDISAEAGPWKKITETDRIATIRRSVRPSKRLYRLCRRLMDRIVTLKSLTHRTWLYGNRCVPVVQAAQNPLQCCRYTIYTPGSTALGGFLPVQLRQQRHPQWRALSLEIRITPQ